MLDHIRVPQRRLERITDAEFLDEVQARSVASALVPEAAAARSH